MKKIDAFNLMRDEVGFVWIGAAVKAASASMKDQDGLAELAYGLTRYLEKAEAKEFLEGIFSTHHNVPHGVAWALYIRGKTLARMSGERV